MSYRVHILELYIKPDIINKCMIIKPVELIIVYIFLINSNLLTDVVFVSEWLSNKYSNLLSDLNEKIISYNINLLENFV